MAKYNIEDIVLSKRPPKKPAPSRATPPPPKERPRHAAHHGRHPWLKPKFVFPALGAAVILLSVIPLSNALGRGTVTVTPKSQPVIVNKEFTAVKEGAGLHFRTVELSSKQSMAAAARGTQEVRRKASGTIVVYNAYTSKPQRLIKNTRFETPEGKVYRIDTGITIPGYTVESGKTIPGSIEAVVYADEPGDSYNIDRSDFTLPGFKGSPQFTKVYARSKTRMTGGFIGQSYALAPEDAEAIYKTLKERLEADFKAQVATNIPPDFVLYPDASFIEYDEPVIVGDGTSASVTVNQEAKLFGLLLSRPELARSLAQLGVKSYDGLPVTAPELDTLTFRMKNRSSLAYRSLDSFSFTLEGSTPIVWAFDEEALKQSLGGTPKKDFRSALEAFPAIASAELSLTPFWVRTIPPGSRLSVEAVR